MKTFRLIAIALTACCASAFAQEKKPQSGDIIYGRVSEEFGPMDRINVTERTPGDRIVAHVQTDANGLFAYRMVNPKNSLVITKTGYEIVNFRISEAHNEITLRSVQDIFPEVITIDENAEIEYVESDGLLFRVVIGGDGATVVQNDIEKPQGDVVIPSSIECKGESYPVTAIDASAFRDCSMLTSVSIPNTVETIGADAFRDCPRLNEIDIPQSVYLIGGRAFRGCTLGMVKLNSRFPIMCLENTFEPSVYEDAILDVPEKWSKNMNSDVEYRAWSHFKLVFTFPVK